MPNRAMALLDGPLTTASGRTITHERAMASARFSGERDWQATLEAPKVEALPYGAAERLLISARDTGQTRSMSRSMRRLRRCCSAPASCSSSTRRPSSATVPRTAVGRDFLAASAERRDGRHRHDTAEERRSPGDRQGRGRPQRHGHVERPPRRPPATVSIFCWTSSSRISASATRTRRRSPP